MNKQEYFRKLSENNLSYSTINSIKTCVLQQHMTLEPVPNTIIANGKYGNKITEQLTRLDLSITRGHSSWEGLVVGFPGTKEDLAITSIGTPYLRMILYPILDLYHRAQDYFGASFPCVYFIGERFSEIFFRKFQLLYHVIPHVILLTGDLYRSSQNKFIAPVTEKGPDHESWTQMKLCAEMLKPGGLEIPTKNGMMRAGMISQEVPCAEGTDNPERLDILAVDLNQKSLVAFEIKGPHSGRVELENLFLQGIEHRNWLEKNKMAVKFLFDGGPGGKKINTRKRVVLVLGFYEQKVPGLFFNLRKEAVRRDRFLEIHFVRFTMSGGCVQLSRFDNDL